MRFELPKGISRSDLLLAVQYEWDKRARANLHDFVRRGWQHAGLPGVFADGRHIRLLCERSRRSAGSRPAHVAARPLHQDDRTNVFWPAWTWLQQPDFSKLLGLGGLLHVTHRDDLAVRDSQRCRQLVKSAWYQELCEGKVQPCPTPTRAPTSG